MTRCAPALPGHAAWRITCVPCHSPQRLKCLSSDKQINPGSKSTDSMKIKDIILSVAKLVSERDIIDHGSIRCLHSDNAVSEIASAEGIEESEVDTGTIGDDALADKLREICDSDEEGKIDFDDLKEVESSYCGDDLEDYLDRDKEDKFTKLETLIDAARKL